MFCISFLAPSCLAEWAQTSCLTALCLSCFINMIKRDSNYLLGLWVHVKCLTQCQTHAKLSIKVSSDHQRYAYFRIDHLVMSMCRVVSCVVGRGCLLWPVHSLGKTLLAFALLHFVLQGQTCLLLWVSLDFLLCIPVPCDEKNTFFWC